VLKCFRSISRFCSARKHDLFCDQMAKWQTYYSVKKKTNLRIFHRFFGREYSLQRRGSTLLLCLPVCLSVCLSVCPQSIRHKLCPYQIVNILDSLKGERIFHSNTRNSAGNGNLRVSLLCELLHWL
jgi:hypothetical protein